ncbi:MAG TPA: hypothetical protein VEI83_06890 [Acidimicrobiales bacterium]|nr:hypothetical protein [Acidimicrobiales bacterium]
MNNRVCAAFLPWFVFDLVVRCAGESLTFAAFAALVVGLVVALPSLRGRSATTVETTSIVLFGGLAIAGAVVSPDPHSTLMRGSVGLTTAGLAAVMLLSLMRTPATTDYARRCVPRTTAESPRFAILNMTLTAVWGVAFALVAGSQAVAGFVSGPHIASISGWLVPLGILLATTRATAGLWADYHERDAVLGQGATLVDGLLWDLPPSFDDEL